MIELIIAMGITLVIMFVAAYTVGTSGEVQGRANARLEVLLSGRTGIDLLQEDLAGAQIDAGGYVFQVQNAVDDDGVPADTLIFTASAAGVANASGSVRLYYFRDQETNALIRYEAEADSVVADWSATNTAADAVLYGVQSFDVQAHDGQAPSSTSPWMESWDSINDTDGDGVFNEPDATTTDAELRQYRRMPTVARVTLIVQDTAGYIENTDDADPLDIIRLMPVGSMAPAH
jgi:hypothetical protein